MRLIMGMSSDGYVAAQPDDDMSWLGPDDKTAFRLLTNVGGDCFASRRTLDLMPESLPGRNLVCVTRKPVANYFVSQVSLFEAQEMSPDGWLLGGQHLALTAFREGLIDEAHLCVSGAECPHPIGLPDLRVPDLVSTMARASMPFVAQNRIGLTTVLTYRR